MKFNVIILPSAERNISEAFEWIAEQNQDAANAWFNRLIEVILSLNSFPERCPLAPECKFLKKEVRQILHGVRHHKYRVLFEIKDQEVRILHVRHAARLDIGSSATE